MVGAGTAGLAAFRAATAAGKDALVIERGPHGTTCARVGCMPSKLLIAAAEAAQSARETTGFGVHAGQIRIDGRAVMARVRSERDRFVGFVLDGVFAIPPERRITGEARFEDDRTLAVGDLRIRAKAIVIATGSSPKVPPAFQALGDLLAVNDDVFSWDDLPSSVAVFGPGVIGLELGQALARLGVRVRVLGRGGSVGPLSDPEVRDVAARLFAREFSIDPDAKLQGFRREGDGVVVDFWEGAAEKSERFSRVLAAVGRAPNVEGLGLEHTTLERDPGGVPRFDRSTLQCGRSSIFLAGDANDDAPILHEAASEGRIAGENAARFPDVRREERSSPLGVVFTDPQMAMVGTRFVDLPEDVAIGAVSFVDQGRSRVMRKNAGLLRVYAERSTGRFLGAEGVGPRLEHIGHLLAWSHQSGLTLDAMLRMPFYHPVVEEGLRTALRDARSRLA